MTKPHRYLFAKPRLMWVKDGAARLTFERVKKGGHARLGAAIELALTEAGPFHKGRCAYRARAAFDEDGLVRVFGPDGIGADPGYAASAGEGTRAILYAAERGASTDGPARQEAVAKLAGFTSWPEAWAHIQTLGRKAAGRVVVELIGWGPA